LWENILKLGDFKTENTKNGISINSKNSTKRYYYQEGEKCDIILFLYNSASMNGKDKTIDYIRKIHPYFCIINLLPDVTGNPDGLPGGSIKLDPINFKVISFVLNQTFAPIWVGWGELVRGNTNILFPKKLKDLLTFHGYRLFQIDRGKPQAIYPMHPSYPAIYKKKPPENIEFVPFNFKHLKSY
jgi:hypothetical protein